MTQNMGKQNTKPLVSILMNCYNGEKYIKEAIDSVIAQTYTNWEIIFWDNASIDNSGDIAQSYKDERIKYYKADENITLYGARNLAIKKTKGEFVGFLDIDDKWMPTNLEQKIPLFENPKIGIVYSDTLFFSDDKILSRYYKNKPYFTGKCFRHLLSTYFLSLETVLIRKSALDKQSYCFDNRFNMSGDADLFRRIGHDYELAMINEPLGMWRVDKNSLSWTQTNKFFEETELMLDVYKELYPNFETEYFEEIFILKRDLDLGRAKVCLKTGDSINARGYIKPFLIGGNKKVYMLYLLSLLPSSIIKMIAGNRF